MFEFGQKLYQSVLDTVAAVRSGRYASAAESLGGVLQNAAELMRSMFNLQSPAAAGDCCDWCTQCEAALTELKGDAEAKLTVAAATMDPAPTVPAAMSPATILAIVDTVLRLIAAWRAARGHQTPPAAS
jgi:hypothetical protein